MRTSIVVLALALSLAASVPACAQATNTAPPAHAANSMAARDQAAALAMLQAMRTGNWQAATRGFDATMAAALPPTGVQQLWQQLQAHYGAYRDHGAPIVATMGPFLNVLLPLQFARGSIGLRYAYDTRGDLAGLHLAALPANDAVHAPRPRLAQLFAQQRSCMQAQPVVVASAGAQLHGTLTLPRHGKGPYTALLLIPGSGPVNQNGDVPGMLGDAAYRQLAQGLGCAGYAVLRYNKLGLAPSTGDVNAVTLATYVRNVRDLLAWLAARHDINAQRLLLMGHSEGGLIALAAAKQTPAAGVILLEAPGEPLAKVIAQQALAQARARGESAQAIAHQQAQVAEALAAIRASHGVAMPLHGQLAQNPYAVVFANAAGLLRSELDVDPAVLLHALHRPVLIVQGGKDLQVLPSDGQRLRAAARAGTYRLLPAMTHDLIACQGAAITCLQPAADRRLDAQLLPTLTHWLHQLPAVRRHA